MSKLQVNTIVDKEDVSAPTFSKGAIVTGVTTSTTFSGNLTGNVTGTLTGTASGLAGSPDITVGSNTVGKQLTAEHANVTGVTTAASIISTTSVVVGSAVTANSDGVVTTGIITATSYYGDAANMTNAGITAGKSMGLAAFLGR